MDPSVAHEPVPPLSGDRPARGERDVTLALERGARALIAKQAEDGSWEGEVVWSAMLAAEFVLACHLMDRPIDPVRKRRLLLHFERTRLPSGTWGLSEWSESNLFVTVLVYVASRILGAEAKDPLLAGALAFIRKEGAANIPSWGKFWLAMMNLYAWEGVNPVSPALWGMPRWVPIHPSRYYCHTRLIYMAMAALYGQRLTAAKTSLIEALRLELYPNGFEAIDFAAARTQLRRGDLYTEPSAVLWASYRVLGALEGILGESRRRESLRALRKRIRYELRTTNHTSISPVSGLLNILALHHADPYDPDAEKAFAKLDDWIWEDDDRGTRVTGARSVSWDTSFAVQTLVEVARHVDVREALERGGRFLATQQMHGPFTVSAAEIDRVEPDGGYCFAGVWHGWPVSDCTAEAIVARLASPLGPPPRHDVESAVRFILGSQNTDGGFGSYERRRTPFGLEWLNPAEMFGDSMTENSHVECTASCIVGLARARDHLPDPEIVDRPIARGVERLRALQLPSGAWLGAWGVRLVYGTLFAVRGLLAGGVRSTDPQIRRACEMLKSHQRADGGWGEAHVEAPSPVYLDGDRGLVIQTAWALLALLAAADSDEDAMARAARFLANAQLESGDFSQPEPAGVFFHTALLDYTLYKSYFPVWALAQYETHRKAASNTDCHPEERSDEGPHMPRVGSFGPSAVRMTVDPTASKRRAREKGHEGTMNSPQTASGTHHPTGRRIPRVSGGLPLVGHLVPFVRTAVKLLDRARAECGDVAAFDVGPKKMVLLTGPKASEAFFRAPDDVLNPSEAYKMMEPVFGKDVVYDAPPAKMAEQFSMLLPCLQDKRMRGYGEVIAREVDRSLESWGDEGVIDMYEYTKVLTNFTSSTCLLGRRFRDEMSEEFAPIYSDLERGITPLAYLNAHLPIPTFRKRDRARVQLVDMITRMIADRRGASGEGEDFLQILMETQYKNGERLSEHEITGLLLAAMFAGHHTSAVTAAWMMLELLRTPSLYDRVRDEIFRVYGADGPVTYSSLREVPVTEGSVKETLRMHPPLFMLMRVAMRDWEYDGYVVPKGTNLIVSPTVTHRIPELFREPDRFDPDRFGPGREEDKVPFAFQAFGGGSHKCLGNAFALLQIKTVFAILMRRFEFSLYGDPLEPDFHGIVIGPRQPCRVRYRRIRSDEALDLAAKARSGRAEVNGKAAATNGTREPSRCPATGAGHA
jgi:lanosterol synthase